MDFPAEAWDIFEAADFQLRPNQRAMDHFRVALSGNKLYAATIGFGSIIPIVDLEKLQLRFDFWASDVKIRWNMSTSEWIDLYEQVTSKNKIRVEERSGKAVTTQHLGEILDLLVRSKT